MRSYLRMTADQGGYNPMGYECFFNYDIASINGRNKRNIIPFLALF